MSRDLVPFQSLTIASTNAVNSSTGCAMPMTVDVNVRLILLISCSMTARTAQVAFSELSKDDGRVPRVRAERWRSCVEPELSNSHNTMSAFLL